MSQKRNLRQIHIQSGASDRMGRTIEGIFEVLIDEDDIVSQMGRAYSNHSKQSCDGPVVIRYQQATQAQADFLIKGLAFGKPVPKTRASA